MQTNGKQRIIIVEGTDEPPLDELYTQVDELGDGWRIASATTTTETVPARLNVAGRTYRRYTITAVIDRAA